MASSGHLKHPHDSSVGGLIHGGGAGGLPQIDALHEKQHKTVQSRNLADRLHGHFSPAITAKIGIIATKMAKIFISFGWILFCMLNEQCCLTQRTIIKQLNSFVQSFIDFYTRISINSFYAVFHRWYKIS